MLTTHFLRNALLAAAVFGAVWTVRAAPAWKNPDLDVTLAPLADARVVRTRETINVDGEARRYVITRPANFAADERCMLIVAHHGYRGDVKAWMHEITSFDAHVAEKRFVVVYPEAPIAWLTASPGRDLEFFDALLAAVKKQFPIDERRIFVVGHSNGGSFASFLAYARSDVIAAAAVQAGVGGPANFRLPMPARKAPLLLIWGSDDHVPKLRSEADLTSARALRSMGFPVETMILPDWGHPWGGTQFKVEERVLEFFAKNPLPAR